jgi:vacuolar-type H+-ATPase subunit I/STV1
MTKSKTFLTKIFDRFAAPAKENAEDSLQSIKAQVESCESFIDKTVKLINDWRQQSLKTEDALRDLTARVAAIESRSHVPADSQNIQIYLDVIYRGLLNRDCNEAERKSFGAQLAQGRSLQEIIDEIVASDEYKALKAKTPPSRI